MLARISLLILVIFMLPSLSSALVVSGGIGMGNTTMTNEATETEGPLVQVFTVERLFHSRLSLGVEHIRSLTPNLISSASFTGFLARYYINSAPEGVIAPENLTTDFTVMHDYSVFIGTGFGSDQSSRLPNDVDLSSNSAGFYISPRAGVDYQLTKNLGARGEFIYATSVFGKGSITTMSMGGSLYWLF